MRCEHCQGIRHRWNPERHSFVRCPMCKGTGETSETAQATPSRFGGPLELPEESGNLPFTRRRA